MRVTSWFGATLILVSLVIGTPGCTQREIPPRNPQLTVQLRWIKGYPRETDSNVVTGLSWALSFLGASLPADANVFSWRKNVLTVDLDAAGVLNETRPAWIALLEVLKNSDEYRKTGAIDVGRFLMLTLCSSHQYFALTGAAHTFSDFQSTHRQAWRPAAVVESDIAYGNRLLHIGQAERLADIYFVAFEGKGAIADGTFKEAEIETIDFMPNGQLRFALFDLQGNAKAAANPELTAAGKPSNCLWCHEIRLQRTFKNTTSVPGYYSAAELSSIIQDRMGIVDAYRSNLKSQIDFKRTKDHTYAELLYLSFAEPSANRLSVEWGMSEDAAKSRLRGLPTHRQKEFSFLGDNLYDREAADRVAPFQTIRVPSHVREASDYEPDLIGSGTAP